MVKNWNRKAFAEIVIISLLLLVVLGGFFIIKNNQDITGGVIEGGSCDDPICGDQASCEDCTPACGSTWNIGECSSWNPDYCSDPSCLDQSSCEDPSIRCGSTWNIGECSSWNPDYCSDPACSDELSCIDNTPRCCSTWNAGSNSVAITSCGEINESGEYTLTQDINAEGSSTCVNIVAENTTLNCGGHIITGNTENYGVQISANNATVKNCIIQNFSKGIFFYYSHNSTAENNTLRENSYGGIWLESGGNNFILNNTIRNNTYDALIFMFSENNVANYNKIYSHPQWDLHIYGTNNITFNYFESLCNLKMYSAPNINRNDLMPIYRDEAMTDIETGSIFCCGEGINTNYTMKENISCNYDAFSITADNIILDCAGHTISGLSSDYDGIHIDYRSNVIIRNCSLSGFKNGLQVYGSVNVTLENNLLSGNKYNLYLGYGSLAELEHNIDTSNLLDGKPVYYYRENPNVGVVPSNAGMIAAVSSDGLIAENFELKNNSHGILLANTNNSIIRNNNITSTGNKAIHLFYSSNSSIANNKLTSNAGDGLNLYYSSNNTANNNKIYNNSNYDIYVEAGENNNLTYNYWGGPICSALKNGVSTSALLPYYTDEAMTLLQSSAACCGDTLTSSFTMTEDLSCGSSDGLIFGADNITLDCNGHSISGSDSYNGIYVNGFNNVTIQNCTINDFDTGVYFSSSSDGKIINNSFVSNNNYDLYLDSSSRNKIEDSSMNLGWYGIYLYLSSNNNISRNIIKENYYGVYIDNSENAFLDSNNINVSYEGVYIYWNSPGNVLQNNTIETNDPSCSEWGGCYGIYAESAYNKFESNTIMNNPDSGLYLYSSNNNITNNNITNNYYGIYLGGGSYNNFSHNDIYSNTYEGVYFYGDFNNIFNFNRIYDNANYDLQVDYEDESNDFTSNYWGNYLCNANLYGISRSNILPYYIDYNLTNLTSEQPACMCGEIIYGSMTLDHDHECTSSGVNIEADNVVFDCGGHSIIGTNQNYDGIYIDFQTNVTIKNCTLSNFNNGVYLYYGSEINVHNNTLTNNRYGLFSYYDSSDKIHNNKIYGNTNYDLYYQPSEGEESNNFTRNYWGDFFCDAKLSGITRDPLMPYYIDSLFTNLSETSPVCYCGESIYADTTFEYDYNCPNSGISIGTDNIVLDCAGHLLNGSSNGNTGISNSYNNITMKNCEINNFYHGIYTSGNENNFINNTIVSNDYSGMYLSGAYSNIIKSNKLHENEWYEIYLESSSDNNLTENEVYGDIQGMGIVNTDPSNNNYIFNNNIYNHTTYSFYYTYPTDKDVRNNYWGTINCTKINESIYDKKYSESFGLVTWEPFLNAKYPSGNPITCEDVKEDVVSGNSSTITGNLQNFSISIGGSEILELSYGGIMPVEIKTLSEPILNFNWNFTDSSLNFSEINITTQEAGDAAGFVIIRGLDLVSQGQTKSVFVNMIANTSNVCIKDAPVASVSEIMAACNGANEHSVPCPGTNGAYSCNIVENRYNVSGMSYSGILEYTPPAVSGTGAGGGTGATAGGGSCVARFVCEEWSECADGKQSRVCIDVKACLNNKTEFIDCEEERPVAEIYLSPETALDQIANMIKSAGLEINGFLAKYKLLIISVMAVIAAVLAVLSYFFKINLIRYFAIREIKKRKSWR